MINKTTNNSPIIMTPPIAMTTSSKAKTLLERAIYLRDLAIELVVRNLKLQYKRSILGFVWSQLNPLFQLFVFVVFFQIIFKLKIQHYPLYVFVGMLSWNWYSNCLFQGATSITDGSDLIRKPGFPAAVVPVVSVATQLVQFLLAMPVLLIFIFFEHGQLGAPLLALIPIIAVQFVVCLSIVYLVSALNVMFRDVQHLLGVILLLQFYLTPVFYSAAAVPKNYVTYYDLNPMVRLVEAYRDILVNNTWPHPFHLITLAGVACVILWFSHGLFQRMKDQFVEEIG